MYIRYVYIYIYIVYIYIYIYMYTERERERLAPSGGPGLRRVPLRRRRHPEVAAADRKKSKTQACNEVARTTTIT